MSRGGKTKLRAIESNWSADWSQQYNYDEIWYCGLAWLYYEWGQYFDWHPQMRRGFGDLSPVNDLFCGEDYAIDNIYAEEANPYLDYKEVLDMKALHLLNETGWYETLLWYAKGHITPIYRRDCFWAGSIGKRLEQEWGRMLLYLTKEWYREDFPSWILGKLALCRFAHESIWGHRQKKADCIRHQEWFASFNKERNQKAFANRRLSTLVAVHQINKSLGVQ